MEEYKINKYSKRGMPPLSLFDILSLVELEEVILTGHIHNPTPLYVGPVIASTAKGYSVSYPLGKDGRDIVFFSTVVTTAIPSNGKEGVDHE